MENFVIRNRSLLVLRFLAAIMILIIGGTWLSWYMSTRETMKLVLFIIFFITGLFTFLYGFGLEKGVINTFDSGMRIKWVKWLFSRRIHKSNIRDIVLGRNNVIINISGRRPVKLSISDFRRRQREKIYSYFERYSQEHGIKLLKFY